MPVTVMLWALVTLTDAFETPPLGKTTVVPELKLVYWPRMPMLKFDCCAALDVYKRQVYRLRSSTPPTLATRPA